MIFIVLDKKKTRYDLFNISILEDCNRSWLVFCSRLQIWRWKPWEITRPRDLEIHLSEERGFIEILSGLGLDTNCLVLTRPTHQWNIFDLFLTKLSGDTYRRSLRGGHWGSRGRRQSASCWAWSWWDGRCREPPVGAGLKRPQPRWTCLKWNIFIPFSFQYGLEVLVP